jgi:positive regulator of sigma E activity
MGMLTAIRKERAVYLERDEKGAHLFGPCGKQHPACSGCGACGAGAAAPIFYRGELPPGLEEGDLCELAIEAPSPVLAAFVLFIMPLLLAAGGAFLGYRLLLARLGLPAAPLAGAIAGLLVSIMLSAAISKAAAARSRGVVSITRIGESGA